MANPSSSTDIDKISLPEQQLILSFDGGIADNGALFLDEYASSLEGWKGLFQLLGEIYYHSYPELRNIKGSSLLRIEIVAEKRGSWDSVLIFFLGAIAGGIIGNRADAMVVWSFSKLVDWYKQFISTYVKQKSLDTDITAIVTALQNMMDQNEVSIEHDINHEDDHSLFPDIDADTDAPDPHVTHATVSRIQVLAERVDHLLKEATSTLDDSCERLRLLDSENSSILEFGAPERDVISSPLTLPPPSHTWFQARIRFERINRKTGNALFYFDYDDPQIAAHYSRIIDTSVHEPGNVYTQAFNDDHLLQVWIRQTHPEPGRLNFQWEITIEKPNDLSLFSSHNLAS